jgi:hypothetical protein
VLAIIAAAVFLLNPRKTADLSVSSVDVFAPQTQYKAQEQTVKVLGEGAQTENDLYVVAHISMTDKLRLPLFLFGWTSTATFADGSTQDATVVPAQQLPRLGQMFPQILPMAPKAVLDGTEIGPGSTLNGDIVLLFPNTTEDQWNHKKAATLTIELRNQQAQTVKLP